MLTDAKILPAAVLREVSSTDKEVLVRRIFTEYIMLPLYERPLAQTFTHVDLTTYKMFVEKLNDTMGRPPRVWYDREIQELYIKFPLDIHQDIAQVFAHCFDHSLLSSSDGQVLEPQGGSEILVKGGKAEPDILLKLKTPHHCIIRGSMERISERRELILVEVAFSQSWHTVSSQVLRLLTEKPDFLGAIIVDLKEFSSWSLPSMPNGYHTHHYQASDFYVRNASKEYGPVSADGVAWFGTLNADIYVFRNIGEEVQELHQLMSQDYEVRKTHAYCQNLTYKRPLTQTEEGDRLTAEQYSRQITSSERLLLLLDECRCVIKEEKQRQVEDGETPNLKKDNLYQNLLDPFEEEEEEDDNNLGTASMSAATTGYFLPMPPLPKASWMEEDTLAERILKLEPFWKFLRIRILEAMGSTAYSRWLSWHTNASIT